MVAASSTKPQAWTLSPQMTAAPNLWRGCVFMLPMWLGSGDGVTAGEGPRSTFDLVSSRRCASDMDNSYTWGLGNSGVFIKHPTGADDNSVLEAPDYIPVSGSQNRTVVIVHERVSDITDARSLVQWGTNNNGERWTFRYTAGNLLRYEIQGSGYATSLSPLLNEINVSALVLDGDTFGEIFAYLNGITESTTGTAPVNTTAEHQLHIAGDRVFPRNSPDDKIYMCAIWDRALTVAELDSIYRDPFAMIRPAGF